MLRWAIIFFVIALIAAVLGFGGIAGMSMDIAKFVAVIAVILAIVSFVMNGMRGRGTRICSGQPRRTGKAAPLSGAAFSCLLKVGWSET